MFDTLTIQSHSGPYTVEFSDRPFWNLNQEESGVRHFIVDARVAKLYENQLAEVLKSPSVLLLEATEAAKTLERFTSYVEHLVGNKVRRGDKLVAIGGGIIQDISCFLAATLLRGLDWHFYPTTLLAQADSCIGSKSSINVGAFKNLLGTFTPPKKIFISPSVLRTLDEADRRSGIGEMLKVHIINGPQSFACIAEDYDRLLSDEAHLLTYLKRSLSIKKKIIEEDEFDRGIRNIMNYGHSFGHAIEAATDFGVPHGIAVTIGMDLANFLSCATGGLSKSSYEKMHGLLQKNYRGFEEVVVPMDRFMDALAKDKKNVGASLRLILPDLEARIGIHVREPNQEFRMICEHYLRSERSRK